MAQHYAKLAGRGIESEILMADQRYAAEDDRQKKHLPGYGAERLRSGPSDTLTEPVVGSLLAAIFRAPQGDDLQRWSDPRLFLLNGKPFSCTAVLVVVAVHRELPETRFV
jgi:hypothetical protein